MYTKEKIYRNITQRSLSRKKRKYHTKVDSPKRGFHGVPFPQFGPVPFLTTMTGSTRCSRELGIRERAHQFCILCSEDNPRLGGLWFVLTKRSFWFPILFSMPFVRALSTRNRFLSKRAFVRESPPSCTGDRYVSAQTIKVSVVFRPTRKFCTKQMDDARCFIRGVLPFGESSHPLFFSEQKKDGLEWGKSQRESQRKRGKQISSTATRVPTSSVLRPFSSKPQEFTSSLPPSEKPHFESVSPLCLSRSLSISISCLHYEQMFS